MLSCLIVTIETENYNYISQDFYNKTINSINLNQISCTCGLSGCLTFYGSYKRKVQLHDGVLILTVARVYCSACGHTHALLLSSIVPYSQIPASVQADAIIAAEEGASIGSVLEDQCCVDESNLRSVIRACRLYWKESLLSESILVAPVHLLVRKCFSCFSRTFMQIKTTRNKLQLILSRTETMLMNTTTEKELVKKLREKYTKNPPEGMTAGMIKRMRDSDLLDMDYFLHEDVFGEDVEDGFFIF